MGRIAEGYLPFGISYLYSVRHCVNKCPVTLFALTESRFHLFSLGNVPGHTKNREHGTFPFHRDQPGLKVYISRCKAGRVFHKQAFTALKDLANSVKLKIYSIGRKDRSQGGSHNIHRIFPKKPCAEFVNILKVQFTV